MSNNTKNSNTLSKTEPPRLSVSRQLSAITPEKVEWLWPGRIPLGKITLLAGDPGLGKSIASIDIAARVSTGRTWPDGSEAYTGNVIIISAEDDPGDTIRPRFDAAEGDPSKVRYLYHVYGKDNEGNKISQYFDIDNGLAALEELILSTEAKLVIIDPISAYMPGVDSNNNSAVRYALTKLAKIAQKNKIAILVISHLNKGNDQAQYRVTGSLAFTAVARSVLIIAKDKQNPERRLLLPLKNNLSANTGGMAYSIDTDSNGIPYISWEQGVVDIDIHEALSPAYSQNRSKVDEAVAWLKSLLAEGPMDSKEIEKLAREQGVASKRTLDEAKKVAGITSYTEGSPRHGGKWMWKLPDT